MYDRYFLNLERIFTSFGEHSSRIRVNFDGISEKSDSFLPFTLEENFNSKILTTPKSDLYL